MFKSEFQERVAGLIDFLETKINGELDRCNHEAQNAYAQTPKNVTNILFFERKMERLREALQLIQQARNSDHGERLNLLEQIDHMDLLPK